MVHGLQDLEPALQRAEKNGITVERVNVDEQPERAAEHGITSLPVTILEQEGRRP
jgi:thioredoxin-like negative regulator of GroEL